MSKLDSPSDTSNKSDKTEMIISDTTEDKLKNNLIDNVNKSIDNTDVIELYNNVLMTEDIAHLKMRTYHDIMEYFQLHYVKSVYFGEPYVNVQIYILQMIDLIIKHAGHNKWFVLSLLVYCSNIHYQHYKKVKSNDAFKSMYM